jgi:hypothetical protein
VPINPAELGIGDISDDEIREWVENTSLRTDSFSRQLGNSQVTFKIPGDKLQPFLVRALGVDYVGEDEKLHRELPLFHPVHTAMYCDGVVSVNGVGFDGDDTEAVVWFGQLTPAAWQMYKVVLSFAPPPYYVTADEDIDRESERYVEFQMTGDVQLVNVPNGTVKYDAPGESWNSQPSLQLVTRKEGGGVRLVWHDVPQEYLNEQFEMPTHLLSIQGRCNSGTFFGQDVETLLCKTIDVGKPYPSPLITNATGEPYYMHTLTMDFLWYDPEPKGYVAAVATGWNYMIASDLQYYYATTTAGEKVYQTSDFSKIFTYRGE